MSGFSFKTVWYEKEDDDDDDYYKDDYWLLRYDADNDGDVIINWKMRGFPRLH